jgi:hypothetical protein
MMSHGPIPTAMVGATTANSAFASLLIQGKSILARETRRHSNQKTLATFIQNKHYPATVCSKYL